VSALLTHPLAPGQPDPALLGAELRDRLREAFADEPKTWPGMTRDLLAAATLCHALRLLPVPLVDLAPVIRRADCGLGDVADGLLVARAEGVDADLDEACAALMREFAE
jgi:hypothetical protein